MPLFITQFVSLFVFLDLTQRLGRKIRCFGNINFLSLLATLLLGVFIGTYNKNELFI